MRFMRNGLIRLSRAALCVAACFGGVAATTPTTAAAPALPKVVAGQATFSQDGNVFSITNTPGTIVNWQSFSVNAGEITRFIQQGSDSAVLNRIVGQDPSRILGALQSNGKVFLINPNGVVFGQDARVDVNGLVASTLNMSDADFLAGKKNFSAGPNAGSVRNDGAITTPSGGKVFLVAPNVENAGIITAPNGEVVLAAGRSVQLVDSSNPDLTVVVSAPGDQAINLGQVVSNGGRIGIYGALVNQRGVVNADSAVVGRDGKIVLKASKQAVLEQGSVTSALGAGKGGEIQLLGERVALTGNAQVDASGAAQGGTVLVGGDYQGRNAALPNAQQTSFGKDAGIRADATGSGDGGKVILWSDGATAAHGSISARGAGAGRGGLVETSGRRLDIAGVRVDAGAGKPGGRSGTWLIDPTNIVVASTGADTDTTYINADTLVATNADIVLQASNDLKILQDIRTSYNVRAEAGRDLTVGAAVSSSAGSIDLRAGNRIKLEAGSLLASPNYIDLKAERMTLAGNIDGVGGRLPVVSFNTFSNTTGIFVYGNAVTDEVNGALTLAPGRLAAFKAYEINIGNSGHIGEVVIDAPLTLDGNLVIDSAGRVYLNAPVLLNGATSQFLATQHAPGGLFQVGSASSVDVGRKIVIAGAGRVNVGGALKSGEIELKAGSAGMSLTADITANGRTTLRTGGAITQGSSVVRTPQLLVEAGNVNMLGNNEVGTLAGSAAGTGAGAGFRFRWSGDLRIGSVGGRDGLASQNEITLTGGNLNVDALVDAPLVIQADVASLKGAGTLKSNVLSIQSRGGIGEAGRALRTSANVLMSAKNTATGTAPINIVNDRALVVGNVAQEGTGNGGAISIESTGGMTVSPGSMPADGVRTSSGDISLVTHSPLTIEGRVSTGSGNVTLLADNDGALTIRGAGQVASSSGNVRLTGGQVSYPAGSVLVADPGKLAVVTTTPGSQQPDPVPPLNTCLSNPSTPGCANVIEGATRACMLNPEGPLCAQVLPTVQTCRDNPARLGCALVLQREEIRQCILNPKAPGCGGVLPTYDTCEKSPATYGCAPVIAEREAIAQCIATPKAPGCAATLPPYDICEKSPVTFGCAPVIAEREAIAQCIATPKAPGCTTTLPPYDICEKSPATFGCAPVIAERNAIAQCIATPKAPGCTSTLPQYEVCEKSPATYGCAPVIAERNAVSACMVAPTAPGCGEILPPLTTCRLDAGVHGCAPVLARAEFLACVANPLGAGCAERLPALSVCKAAPGTEGCAQVLQVTFNACLVNRNDPACAGILPTLSQCEANKAMPGCEVVLPTLQQCIGSPTLQGCAAMLPRLEQCAMNPNLPGCEAVLPKPDFCSTHPLDPKCAVFNPAPTQGGGESKKPVAEVQKNTVSLINTRTPKQEQLPPATPTVGTPDGANSGNTGSANDEGGAAGGKAPEQSENQSGPAAGTNTGVKNEKPATKMYCN